jgi:hypothetical protein
MIKIEDAITTALEHLDFVIETFNEATGISMEEKISNVVQPIIQSLDEFIKTS